MRIPASRRLRLARQAVNWEEERQKAKAKEYKSMFGRK
jgi:hypothetical protein